MTGPQKSCHPLVGYSYKIIIPASCPDPVSDPFACAEIIQPLVHDAVDIPVHPFDDIALRLDLALRLLRQNSRRTAYWQHAKHDRAQSAHDPFFHLFIPPSP